MTVAELVQRLNGWPPDTKVVVATDEWHDDTPEVNPGLVNGRPS